MRPWMVLTIIRLGSSSSAQEASCAWSVFVSLDEMLNDYLKRNDCSGSGNPCLESLLMLQSEVSA
jgi:hypothetical protein